MDELANKVHELERKINIHKTMSEHVDNRLARHGAWLHDVQRDFQQLHRKVQELNDLLYDIPDNLLQDRNANFIPFQGIAHELRQKRRSRRSRRSRRRSRRSKKRVHRSTI